MAGTGWVRVRRRTAASAAVLAVAALGAGGCASQSGADAVRAWARDQPGVRAVGECRASIGGETFDNVLTCRIVLDESTPGSLATVLGAFSALAAERDLGDRLDVTAAVGPDVVPVLADPGAAALTARTWGLLRSGDTAVEGVSALTVPASWTPDPQTGRAPRCAQLVTSRSALRSVLAAVRTTLAAEGPLRSGCVEVATAADDAVGDHLSQTVAGDPGTLDAVDALLAEQRVRPVRLTVRDVGDQGGYVAVEVADDPVVVPLATALAASPDLPDVRGTVASPRLDVALDAVPDETAVRAGVALTLADLPVEHVAVERGRVVVEVTPGAPVAGVATFVLGLGRATPATRWQLRRDGHYVDGEPVELAAMAPAVDAAGAVVGVDGADLAGLRLTVDLESWDDETVDALVTALRGAGWPQTVSVSVGTRRSGVTFTSTAEGPARVVRTTGSERASRHLLERWDATAAG